MTILFTDGPMKGQTHNVTERSVETLFEYAGEQYRCVKWDAKRGRMDCRYVGCRPDPIVKGAATFKTGKVAV